MTNSPRSEAASGHGPVHAEELDPFDLPEWLGTERVVWAETDMRSSGEHLQGELTGPEGQLHGCDLFAVDVAYPAPVADEQLRTRAHQYWARGEILTVNRAERLTLAVPGTCFNAELLLEALGRLARAVGAAEGRYVALLSVSNRRRRG